MADWQLILLIVSGVFLAIITSVALWTRGYWKTNIELQKQEREQYQATMAAMEGRINSLEENLNDVVQERNNIKETLKRVEKKLDIALKEREQSGCKNALAGCVNRIPLDEV